MPEITIDKKKYKVEEGLTIIQACEQADIEIPRFCYHERLSVAGNCRMCLVEVVGGPPKPVASCAMPVNEGMEIFTNSPMVKKAREGVMEFLLANHPLDCPICDQGGECDLQDQAYQYGRGKSEYCENKRAVKDKYMGPLIKTHMTRCIHCTRCVRFIEDIAGTCEIGAANRGENMEITTYLEKSISSELSGNIIDLCPVGALTSKPYAFKARSWELNKTSSIDIMDGVGSNIRIDSRGVEIMRILPRLNEDINEEWISDKTRFCYDGLKYQRLDKAYIKKDGKLVASNQEIAISEAAKRLSSTDPNKIAILTGQLSSLEEIFILKKISDHLKIEQIDCRLNDEKIKASDPMSYLFNTTISGIEEADFCLIIGSNPRKDAPIINARIRKRYLSGELKIAAIGCNSDLTYKYLNLGRDLSVIEDILANKHEICNDLKNSKKPMLVFGRDAINKNNGYEAMHLIKSLAEKFGFIKKDWNGFNFLARSSGVINGLALGFSNDLTTCSKIIDKCQNGDIETVVLHGVDDDIDFENLNKCFVIYIGSHGDRGAHVADIILPSASFAEKEASYINVEGRIQKTQKAVANLTNTTRDFDLLINLAKEIGCDLESKNHSDMTYSTYKALGAYENSFITSNYLWQKASKKADKIKGIIQAQDYDFYLTNPIARASRILNKCSAENNQS